MKIYENRWKFYLLSLAIMAFGIIMLFVNGIKLDIQFKGGAVISYTFDGELDFSAVDSIVTETLGRDVEVQETISNISEEEGSKTIKKLVLNLAGNEGLSTEDQIALDAALREAYPDANFAHAGSNVVKPFVGARFFRNSIRALILAGILMIIYVWYSFRKVSGLSAGVMSFVALLHDVALVFFVFIIFNIPLNDSFIAVALTILGYSINDTIVIFDRIRENKRLYGSKMPIEQLVNKSITQSITRSVNTSITTVAVTIIIFIFALIFDIESIKTFALPMVFGLVSGCYSTIFLAGPLWTSWQKYKTKGKAKTA